ncbi:hypothetical protein [Streptomyces sp. SLBN-31]|uniref:hypothetical protein n=1 Tax=Streptomyces sp. SLBN-31 TaxID=2768444 RepID=UPI00115424D9|nr:hypothetical protein [Streptomyces sp. SLBN-31]
MVTTHGEIDHAVKDMRSEALLSYDGAAAEADTASVTAGLPLSEGAESFEAAELQLSLVMCSPSTPAHWRKIRSTPADWPWCGKARLEALKAAARSRKSVAAFWKNLCRSPRGAGTSGAPHRADRR